MAIASVSAKTGSKTDVREVLNAAVDGPLFAADNVVVMSEEDYENIVFKELFDALAAGEDDIANGRVYSVEEVFAEYREKYGF